MGPVHHKKNEIRIKGFGKIREQKDLRRIKKVNKTEYQGEKNTK